MNYLKEILAFHDCIETKQLSPIDQALWYHLMHINNKTCWDEWFTVANITLQARLGGIDKKTLNRHRSNLAKHGLIEYVSQGKSQAGKYRIISRSIDIGGDIRGDIRGNIPPETPLLNKPNNKQNICACDFDDEWSNWPKKVNKGDAHKKYASRRKEFSKEQLSRALSKYLKYWQVNSKGEIKYCKEMANVLKSKDSVQEWIDFDSETAIPKQTQESISSPDPTGRNARYVHCCKPQKRGQRAGKRRIKGAKA